MPLGRLSGNGFSRTTELRTKVYTEMDLKERVLVSGCPGEECGWNTQLRYFTGSSLSRDDKSLFLISDRDGSPNVIVRDLATGTRAVWYNTRHPC